MSDAPVGPERRLVLCEGYDDRAFWAAWLERNGARKSKYDALVSKEIRKGQYGYETKTGHTVVIIPHGGDRPRGAGELLARDLRVILEDGRTEQIDMLVVSLDLDTREVDLAEARERRWTAVSRRCREACADMVEEAGVSLIVRGLERDTRVELVC